ncbi:hypothetical protein QNI19_08340 [Cytophagaceae bacterium DM2B3-1]|uniref:Uncharacterized protein n=2 Tax=Xanthocytophaga flava TaxID=3048013 RepID=A0ABT7CIR6_9BACT|nr:hypothetical protein [Xanthocytophaga flavus]MDJ1492937.1 hypothetical protein [Xanthocytophaga flavus]
MAQTRDERMAAIHVFTQEWFVTNHPQSTEEAFQKLSTLIHQHFYENYSSWDTEYDLVERVIWKAITSNPNSCKGYFYKRFYCLLT